MLEELGFVLCGERLGLGAEGSLCGFVEWRWRGGARGDGDADFGEEVFLPSGGADAEKADGLVALVLELVWGVGGDVEGLAGGGY